MCFPAPWRCINLCEQDVLAGARLRPSHLPCLPAEISNRTSKAFRDAEGQESGDYSSPENIPQGASCWLRSPSCSPLGYTKECDAQALSFMRISPPHPLPSISTCATRLRPVLRCSEQLRGAFYKKLTTTVEEDNSNAEYFQEVCQREEKVTFSSLPRRFFSGGGLLLPVCARTCIDDEPLDRNDRH